MSEKYIVKITPQAQERLREIIGYIRVAGCPGTLTRLKSHASNARYNRAYPLYVDGVPFHCMF